MKVTTKKPYCAICHRTVRDDKDCIWAEFKFATRKRNILTEKPVMKKMDVCKECYNHINKARMEYMERRLGGIKK